MDILTKIYHKQKQQSEIVNSFSDKKVSFDSSQMIISVETIIFDILSVRRAKFSKIHVNPVLSFLLSDLDEADFGKTYENLNFTYCNLTHTNFVCSSLLNPVFIGNNLAFTNMSHANLSNAHFQLMNNFSHADLRNALGITDDVFHSALSLDNTHLPNGTQIKDNPEVALTFNKGMKLQEPFLPTLGMFPFESIKEEVQAEQDRPFIVDLGGGRGHMLEIIRKATEGGYGARMILQDTPEVLENIPADDIPGIERMAHDFYTPQPVKSTLPALKLAFSNS